MEYCVFDAVVQLLRAGDYDLKTGDFRKLLEKIFEKVKVWKVKSIRAGRGKMRGRKYKSNAGLLFVIGSDEKMARKGIDVVGVGDLGVGDLTLNGVVGRKVCYTKSAIEEIGSRFKMTDDRLQMTGGKK